MCTNESNLKHLQFIPLPCEAGISVKCIHLRRDQYFYSSLEAPIITKGAVAVELTTALERRESGLCLRFHP